MSPFLVMPLLWSTFVAASPQQVDRPLLSKFRGEFIDITPGQGIFPKSFQMGRADGGSDLERPVHRVIFEYRFAVAKYEVTQELWRHVMGSNPSRWKGARNSVEMLDFSAAESFCRRVTKLLRSVELIDDDQVIRLPSEAEWEYFGRAGTITVYSFGDSADQLTDFAWYTGNAAGNDPPVGAKQPNPWGLYDIHGYLWEWCADVGQENYVGAPSDGTARDNVSPVKRGVIRGGSWKDPAAMLTSSFRRLIPRETRDDAIGLRCVLARESQDSQE